MKNNLLGLIVVFLLILSGCSKVENPLTQVKKGVWVPVASSPKTYPFRLIDAPDTIRYPDTPIWVIGDTLDEIITKNDHRFAKAKVGQIEDGTWYIEHQSKYNRWTLALNESRDTITATYLDEQKMPKQLNYVLLLEKGNITESRFATSIDAFSKKEWMVELENKEKTFLFFKESRPAHYLGFSRVWIDGAYIVSEEKSRMPHHINNASLVELSYEHDLQLSHYGEFLFIDILPNKFIVSKSNATMDSLQLLSTSWNNPNLNQQVFEWYKTATTTAFLDSVKYRVHHEWEKFSLELDKHTAEKALDALMMQLDDVENVSTIMAKIDSVRNQVEQIRERLKEIENGQ